MRRRHHVEEEGEGELNLVPYLDMMVTLVMFLLFSFQAMIEMGMIPQNAPSYGADAGTQQQQPDQEKKLMITLIIGDTGYTLQSDDPDVLPKLDIPKKDGQYDLATLRSTLVNWKGTYTLGDSMVLTAFNTIEYQTVVDAMDAIRKDQGKDLFPNVVLAVPFGG